MIFSLGLILNVKVQKAVKETIFKFMQFTCLTILIAELISTTIIFKPIFMSLNSLLLIMISITFSTLTRSNI